ncbi:MAG TPA: hypothetical protein VGF45_06015, partial [Polyangia bacterium]
PQRMRGPSEFSSAVPETSGNPGGASLSMPREHPAHVPTGALTRTVGTTVVTLNEYRGLHVIDASAAQPRLQARLPMSGRPVALFFEGTTAVAVLADIDPSACAGCPPERADGSRIYVIDLTNPGAPITHAPVGLKGSVVAAHLRGLIIDVVARSAENPSTAGEATAGTATPPEPVHRTAIKSFDLGPVLAGAAPVVRGELELPGPEWADQVHFAGDAVYLAMYGARRWIGGACVPSPPVGAVGTVLPQGCSRIVAVNLTTLAAGPAGSVEMRGRSAVGGLDLHDGVLRIVRDGFAAVKEGPPVPPSLFTLAVSPAELIPSGEVSLSPARAHSTVRFHFAGDRVLVMTDDLTTPLLAAEVAPGRPPALTPLGTKGMQARNVVRSTPTRLLVTELQVDDLQCAASAVLSLYDVTALSASALLARTPLPLYAEWGTTALSDTLVAAPTIGDVSAGDPATRNQALQLFAVDLTAGTISMQGRAPMTGRSHTSMLAVGTGKLMVVSQERAEFVDVSDPASPHLEGAVDLARWIADIKFTGDHAVVLVNDMPLGQSFLRLLPASDPDAVHPVATLTLDGQMGRMFVHDRFIYLFWSASRRVGGTDPRLDIIEITDGGFRQRASRSLHGPASLPLGSENDGDGAVGRGLLQVAGTTFVVSLSRVTECGDPGGRGSASPGSMGRCTPPLPAAEATQLPRAPAIADTPTAAEIRRRLDGACPGSGADLMVLDASNPDDPRVASLLQLSGKGYIGASVVQGRKLFVQQDDFGDLGPFAPGRVVRHYVSELDVTDAAAPVLGPPVNVPGQFLWALPDRRTWFTAQARSAGGKFVGVDIVTLYHPPGSPRAFEEHRLALDGDSSSPVVDGGTLFTTSAGSLVAVDLMSSTGPMVVSRTTIPGRSTGMHRVVGGHAFVMVDGRTMRVFDVRNPRSPRLLDHTVVSPRGAHPVRLAPGNRAIVPLAEWGLEVVPLAP